MRLLRLADRRVLCDWGRLDTGLQKWERPLLLPEPPKAASPGRACWDPPCSLNVGFSVFLLYPDPPREPSF